MGYKKINGTNSYCIVARVRINGKILHKQQTLNCTRERAKSLFEQFKKELREGDTSQRSLKEPIKFREALTFYLERHNVGKSLFYYNTLINDLGDTLMSDLLEKFDKYIQLLKVSRVKRTGELLKNATINQYVLRAKSALSFAVIHNLIEDNPIKRLPILKTVARDVSLSQLEQQRLLDTIQRDNPHIYVIVKYALQVPCRKNELISMKYKDLDLFNNCIRVKTGTTKNDIGIYKPIPPDMLDYFRTLPTECEYLFYRNDKKGYHGLGDFKKAWLRCLKNADITGITFHDLRHISASAMIDAGTPERVVMQIAGWKTNMLSTYYHKSKESLKLVRFQGQCDSVCVSEKKEAV